MENIISAAVGTGARAIHPGFGFLSENSLLWKSAKYVILHSLVQHQK
ncbi:MAG: biotin carboxylase N-terminal domain-containing protein [Ruminococcus sp.]